MFREIQPEDLIMKADDGAARINHRMVCDFGLFNLSQDLQNRLLNIYLNNASEKGEKERYVVSTYIRLCQNINSFPFPVITNFTSGAAYEYNMSLLEPFAE